MKNSIRQFPNAPGVYKIVCMATGKVYVGSSIRLRSRGWAHLGNLRKGKHGNPHLQSAWNKYGEEQFEIEILEQCASEDLIRLEQEWMDRLRVVGEGFNLVPRAGGSVRGRGQTEEAISLRAESQRGKKHVYKPETLTALKERMSQRKLSPEERLRNGKRMMDARKANPEEYTKALSEGRRVYHFDPDHLKNWTNREIMDHYKCTKFPIREARKRMGLARPTGRPKRPSTTEEIDVPPDASGT